MRDETVGNIWPMTLCKIQDGTPFCTTDGLKVETQFNTGSGIGQSTAKDGQQATLEDNRTDCVGHKMVLFQQQERPGSSGGPTVISGDWSCRGNEAWPTSSSAMAPSTPKQCKRNITASYSVCLHYCLYPGSGLLPWQHKNTWLKYIFF